MHLVDHWVIGFSGKRQLSNPEGVRVAIRRVLEELHSDFGRRRVLALPAIAFLAEGNDAFIRRDLPGQISQKQTARVCRFGETHFTLSYGFFVIALIGLIAAGFRAGIYFAHMLNAWSIAMHKLAESWHESNGIIAWFLHKADAIMQFFAAHAHGAGVQAPSPSPSPAVAPTP